MSILMSVLCNRSRLYGSRLCVNLNNWEMPTPSYMYTEIINLFMLKCVTDKRQGVVP